jgi:DNA replication protein DnaC
LEQALTNLEARQANATFSVVRWDAMFAHARNQIQRGRQRDEIQATRPEGCTCLGTAKILGQTADGEWYHNGYCTCPDGIAAKAEWEQELALKRARDIEAFLDRTDVPPRFEDCTFETYPGTVPQELSEWDSVDGDGLFIHGDYGTGKTGLAVSVMKAYIRKHCRSGLFLTVPAILDEIRATYGRDAAESESALVDRVLKVPFLVMDDIGAERPTEWVVEKLFTLINHRHDHMLTTVFTSNLSIPELAERIGERTTWRIVEMSTVVHLKGKNLREKKR